MEQILFELVAKYPTAMSVIVIIGVFRAIFKPLMAVAEKYVQATPSESDDKKLEEFKQSGLHRALLWLVDYTTSIKLPTKK